MSFTNIYYKREVATQRPCYICYMPTTTVLATAQTTDFLYTCPPHLEDPGFATLIGGDTSDGVSAGASKALGISAEEIEKVKKEWEAQQAMKKEKEKEREKAAKAKAGEKPDKGKEAEKAKDKADDEAAKDTTQKDADKTPLSPSPAQKPPPVHKRYSLHRDFFAMRLAKHRKGRDAAQVKDLVPRLPGVPTGKPTKGP